MDPFAAIGLAGNIIAFIDFGFKVVQAAKEVKDSASGASAENDHVEFLTAQIQDFTLGLHYAKPASDMSADEQRLNSLVTECQSLSEDLLKLVQTLKVDPASKRSKRQAFTAVFRNMRKKDERDDLLARLERCKQQLHLQLSQTNRLETQAKLTSIINSSKCHETELQKLSYHVETLRSGVELTSLGPDLLADIRGLLHLTDEAIEKVLQSAVLDVLKLDKMNDRYDTVEEAYENTFNWLLDDEYQPTHDDLKSQDITRQRQQVCETFVGWLSAGKGIFHISGKPGSGKSTLMKYLCENNRTHELLTGWSSQKQLVFAKFFFWRHGTAGQKSLNGLLRSLLFSIFSELPGLVESIFPRQWNSARDSKPFDFSQRDIQHAFEKLIKRHDVFEKHKFAFFIDGLDEFEGRDEKLIASLFSWVEAWPDEIKICVSSRELPIFQQRFSKCPKFRLHELTEPDVRIFVRDSLENNEDVRTMTEDAKAEVLELGNTLVEKAEGVFLWVTLALKSLEQGILIEDPIRDLKRKIDSLPRQVEELFGAIFESINKDLNPLDRQRTLRTLALVVASVDAHFDVPQLQASFLDEYGDDKDFADGIPAPLSDDEIQVRLRRCRKQIEGRCRGLLSIVDRKDSGGRFGVAQGSVKFTHRSLVEYFRRPEVMASSEPHFQKLDILDFKCQAFLAELKCVVGHLSRDQDDQEEDRLSGPDTRSDFEAYSSRPPHEKNMDQLQREISQLSTLFYELGYPETPRLMETVQPLILFAERHLDPPSFPLMTFSCSLWDYGTPSKWRTLLGKSVECRASHLLAFDSAAFGLYDITRTTGSHRESLERHISENQDTLRIVVQNVLDWVLDQANYGGWGSLVPKELLRTLLGCLELGVSPSDAALQTGRGGSAPQANLWQLAIWSLFSYGHRLTPEPFLLAFLVYGADPCVSLEFRDIPGHEDHVAVCCRFGSENVQPFPRRFISISVPGNEEILKLAEESGGTLSLGQIWRFWCPASIDKFERVVELNANRGGTRPTADEVKELKREFGLDVDDWKDAEWSRPKRLLTPDEKFSFSDDSDSTSISSDSS
ncbi:hypothetical protein ACJ41O_014817 [Fusarium nematophilum]